MNWTAAAAVAVALAEMTLSTPAVGQDRLRDDALLGAIRARVAATPGAIVAVSYNDATGASIARLNADSVFHAASTMKIPVMIEVLRRAQAGAFTMDQPVLLINQFASIVDGSPFSLDAAEDSDSALYRRIGERVPIRELMRRMITHSSNLATNELIALVGAERTTAMARTLGARHMQVLRGVEDQKAFDRGLSNTTTADDLAALLTAIENGRALSPASSAEMRDILLAQAFNEKIPAGLPPGTRVAHKTGEITAVSHDAAIVYPAGRKPYVLVVLTRGVRDGAASSALIADVSRLVYAHAVAGI
ncbi:MAG: class A beta-lactamase-related serine hydrolase [Gemmatimonadota bacterium]|nr:class A beta-lactamase-related serine hydrolase [Gemmatimonadota bacterium]